jgi:type III pantothenate kinase
VTKLLAIDAGNSYVKLAYHDGQAWLALERIALPDFCAAPQRYLTRQARQVIIANVAGPAFQAALEAALPRASVQWVTATQQAGGVTNCYESPAQLGADRWAMLIAARAISNQACVVVSIGTALTVDMLAADGRFMGGIIAPGIELMRDALAQGTHAIHTARGQVVTFPHNTADAVETGLVYALAGAIEKLACEFEAQARHAVSCILTGGGAHFVAPCLNRPVQVVDNLVLEGLLLLARKEMRL